MTSYPEGTIVTVKGRTDRLTVEEYVSAAESDDNKAFYWLSTESGLNDTSADEEDVTLVMSAADAAKRKLPTAEEVVDQLNLLSWELNATESGRESDGVRYVYAKTDEGLPYTFLVTVNAIQRSDW